MRPGEWVQAGRRFVRVEEVKDDGRKAKVKISGHWVPASGVKALHPAAQAVLDERERARTERMWAEVDRSIRALFKLMRVPYDETLWGGR